MAGSGSVAPGRIFISYRRAEAAYPTAWLYERLATHFGREDIVRDIDSIEPGDDFGEVIGRAVASCDVMLVVIGPRWISITDDDGRRRLDDSEDFVRREIEAALHREIRVIPILIDGASVPRSEQLPPSLVKLSSRQAVVLSPDRFQSDFDRLLPVLDRTVSEEKERRHAEEQRPLVAPAPANETPPETVTPSASAGGRTSRAFGFETGMQFHPSNSAWGLSYNAAKAELFLATPFNTGVLLRAADLPPHKWVRLTDRTGRPAPVEVLADDVTVHGRWLF
jgi:hypothetical protein